MGIRSSTSGWSHCLQVAEHCSYNRRCAAALCAAWLPPRQLVSTAGLVGPTPGLCTYTERLDKQVTVPCRTPKLGQHVRLGWGKALLADGFC